MTEQQIYWLTENSFTGVEIATWGAYSYTKEFKEFKLELWCSSTNWFVSVQDANDEILLATLPHNYDFNKLTPLIKCYDELERY